MYNNWRANNDKNECRKKFSNRMFLLNRWTNWSCIILNDLERPWLLIFFYKNLFKKSFSQFMNFLISHGAFPSRQRTFLYRASDTHINVHVSRVDLLLTCCTTYTGYLPVIHLICLPLEADVYQTVERYRAEKFCQINTFY